MSDKERKSFLSSGELISISEAAQFTPYSAEYLSLRARTGHLKAMKIARNWLTTRGAVLSYLKEQERKHRKSFEDMTMHGFAHQPQVHSEMMTEAVYE